jgi:Na+/melibiose symporter-like transporter
MLPDVIDEFMIKTGERKESIFYSFFVFFTKLSAGVAIAVSTLILEYLFC